MKYYPEPKVKPPKPKGIKRMQWSTKKGIWQYIKQYRWKKGEKRYGTNDTPLCDSVEEAFAEAKRLKKEKERNANAERMIKRSGKRLLINIFDEDFMAELLANKNTKNKDDKNTGEGESYSTALTMRKHYFPDFIKVTPINKVSKDTFKDWLNYINSNRFHKKPLGGKRVRKYKTLINKFITFLYQNGYISEEVQDESLRTIEKFKLKSPDEGSRRRHPLTVEELEALRNSYLEDGLDKFKNMYWYTLLTFFFCTGLRVEELLGLQWCHINFSAYENYGEIRILNSITDKEEAERVKRRVEIKQGQLKNIPSKRRLTMWHSYRNLLYYYKEDCFRWYFRNLGYEDSEIENMFVFPRIQNKENPALWQTGKYLRDTMQARLEKLGLPKTDLQMFRHACVEFCCKDLNLEREDIHDYFGHQDTEMIDKVYQEASDVHRMIKVNFAMKRLIGDFDEKTFLPNQKTRLAILNKTKNDIKDDLILNEIQVNRMTKQIQKVLSKREVYYVSVNEFKDVYESIYYENNLNGDLVFVDPLPGGRQHEAGLIELTAEALSDDDE